jgi:hypothetical protein
MQKQVLSATALALLIGVSSFTLDAAIAQNGSEARSNDREVKKTLDDKHLTPIRPIRRVGEDNWPDAKNQPAPVRETTGQSAKTEEKKEEKKAESARKPDTKQTQNKDLGNQAPPPDKPQDTAKQNAPQPKQDTAKQDAKQDSAKPEQKQETAKQDAAKPDSKPDAKPQDTAANADQDKTNDQKNDKGFASIRLGTDKDGRVAVNDAQEKQITKAIRKQHVDTFNVKVSVGSVAPANVKLVSVSSDVVDVLPQFRGYSYFATREDIVIVEPSSKKVVALIPIKTTATASRPSEERTTARSTDTRPAGRSKTVVKERDVTVGTAYPTEEEIIAAPVTRAPPGTAVTRSYRTYRYEPYYYDDDVVVNARRPHRPRRAERTRRDRWPQRAKRRLPNPRGNSRRARRARSGRNDRHPHLPQLSIFRAG